tara:strand:- start:48 stop:524 length:477 start_codon:yes stop_codon:yes gene_type:complete
MSRYEIIKKVKQYFTIQELVGRETFAKHGQRSFKFLSTDILETLLILREATGKKITINSWKWGGTFSQRGLRSNVQGIFKSKTNNGRLYLSGHVLGKAFDLDVEGMTAPEVRTWIKANQQLFPHKIRLERNKGSEPINWVHIDTMNEEHNPHIYEFDV